MLTMSKLYEEYAEFYTKYGFKPNCLHVSLEDFIQLFNLVSFDALTRYGAFCGIMGCKIVSKENAELKFTFEKEDMLNA